MLGDGLSSPPTGDGFAACIYLPSVCNVAEVASFKGSRSDIPLGCSLAIQFWDGGRS